MSTTKITSRQATQILNLFHAYVLHQVTLFEIGEKGLWEAVCELRTTAVRRGLVATFGVSEIEFLIGSEFEAAGVAYAAIRPKEGIYP